MHVRDLAPDALAKLVRKYLDEVNPDTRKRAISLLKAIIGEYK